MKRTSIFVLVIALLVAVAPSLGQGLGNECTPVGTWYGGSDTVADGYLLKVVETRPGHYSAIFHGAYSPTAFEFPVMTIWSGEFTREKKGDFEYAGTAISLLNKDVTFPGRPEIWAVRYHAKLDGCDAFKIAHDFFGGYRWGSKVPFKDAPDYTVAPTPINETYHRVPTECPVCSSTP